MKTKSDVQTKLATHILHEANRIYAETGPQRASYICIDLNEKKK